MPLSGNYEPSTQEWVRDQVERYEATGGREANALRDTGLPVVDRLIPVFVVERR